MYKPELYELIKLNNPRFSRYKTESLLAEYGHLILRLPTYHPDLNPIEFIWASVKDYVAKKNITFNFDDAIKLVNQKLDSITEKEWTSRCMHVIEREKSYLRLERVVDESSEQIIIRLGEDSDTSSDDAETDDDDDSDMSGIEPLS
mgnify:CR=1 FL=1